MGAILAKKLVNWQALQERLDLQAVYRLTYLYENEGRHPQQCSYEEQYLEVHRSITKQLRECLCNLHKQIQCDFKDQNLHTFSLSMQKSSIPHPLAGNGVFLKGNAVPGTFITFHPGLVYLAKDVRKIANYPDISEDNCFLMSRYDGCVVDAKDFDIDIKLPSGKSITHPFAFGHMINHPPPVLETMGVNLKKVVYSIQEQGQQAFLLCQLAGSFNENNRGERVRERASLC
ncbi:uncharacterized protein [Montipora foliosa]|uniref:uncharacterized protein isoform X2 n=1 Tax=Montipora foliosa TaxID=591990 RepID=UPI0035F1AFFA